MNIIETIELTEPALTIKSELILAIMMIAGIFGAAFVIFCLVDRTPNYILACIVALIGVAVAIILICGVNTVYRQTFQYDAPTGEKEYHIQLTDMTPEELAQKYQIITYENDYWVVTDKTK